MATGDDAIYQFPDVCVLQFPRADVCGAYFAISKLLSHRPARNLKCSVDSGSPPGNRFKNEKSMAERRKTEMKE